VRVEDDAASGCQLDERKRRSLVKLAAEEDDKGGYAPPAWSGDASSLIDLLYIRTCCFQYRLYIIYIYGNYAIFRNVLLFPAGLNTRGGELPSALGGLGGGIGGGGGDCYGVNPIYIC